MDKTYAVLGSGNVGTALALVLAEHGKPVRLYAIEPDVAKDINRNHRNSKYLKGVSLPKNITAHATIAETVADAQIVILAVPSFALRQVVTDAIPYLKSGVIVGCITKGLDEKTLKPMGAETANALPIGVKRNFCLIGGPAVANEIARHKPSAVVVAGENLDAARKLAGELQGDVFKAGTSRDVKGVGYAMALKNAYAIALGLTQGLGHPMNTQALVMTEAVTEMGRFLKACGAEPETAMSLAGLGDLLVTGLSPHGRNRSYGEKLVRAKTKDAAKLGLTTVEGTKAAPLMRKLARRHKLKTPLLDAVLGCLEAENDFAKPFVEYLKNLRLN